MNPLRSLRFLTLFAVATLLLGGCRPGKHLRKANVDEVIAGMSKKQVESILGSPNSQSTLDSPGGKVTTYVYTQGKDAVTVLFKDDKVQSKDSTLSE